MPRRQRDYKAEYATRKRKSQAAGYKSVREYSRTRQALNLPRNTSPVPKRILTLEGTTPLIARMRKEAKAWSDIHSHRSHSRYHPWLTDVQVERYWLAFVDDLSGPEWIGESEARRDFEKRIRIKRYLVPDFLPGEKEWETNPSTVPLRR